MGGVCTSGKEDETFPGATEDVHVCNGFKSWHDIPAYPVLRLKRDHSHFSPDNSAGAFIIAFTAMWDYACEHMAGIRRAIRCRTCFWKGLQ